MSEENLLLGLVNIMSLESIPYFLFSAFSNSNKAAVRTAEVGATVEPLKYDYDK
jgi:hypothetical protein